jgi:tetratricopeptide (TPR) repeat protein
LLGGYYSDFRPRPPGSPGDDRFFRFDGSLGWVEVTKGAEPVDSARAANPNWEQDHRELARLLGGAGDWPAAVIELAKLASARPDQLEYPLNAGVACERAGDSTGAAEWYARAAALPGADDEIRARARRFKPYLRGAPPGR